jgi:uncharacterized membrane protein
MAVHPTRIRVEPGRRRWRVAPFPALVVAAVGLFLAAPWSLEHKAHMALHGLCAQRPSHTFAFDGRLLPFDGRMTGIYGGFLVTAAYLVACGRHRAFGLPRWPVLGALALGVGALAVDGTNSLLVDLRLWHPYEPANLYRLATGLATGVALAVAVCFMVSTTVWRTGRARQRVVEGLDEVGLLALLQLPFAWAVLAGPAWFYFPLTIFLLVAATAAIAALMLVVVVLLRRQEGTFTAVVQMQGAASWALIGAVIAMALLAGGRVLLEQWTGAQPMM